MSLRIVQFLGSILVMVLLLGFASQAHGKRRDSNKKRSQKHYVSGKHAYNVGEFDTAITEWKAGYKLHGSAVFLFNIAQAYRGKREYAQAIFFLNAYLREKPDAKNAEAVKTLRDEIERLLKEEENSKRMRPKEPISPNAADIKEKSADRDPTRTSTSVPGAATSTGDKKRGGGSLKTAGLITGGTGLALLATSIGFAAAASSAESELEQASKELDPWDQRLKDLEASGSRNASLATGFAIAGAAAVLGGVGIYYFGIRKDQANGRVSVTVVPTVGPRQAGATLLVQF